MSEGNAMRDVGPYASTADALAQFDAVTAGLPAEMAVGLVLTEAVMLGRVRLSEFERETLADLAGIFTDEQAQVIAGLIVRAHLAGLNGARVA